MAAPSIKNSALKYAEKGIPVFPCQRNKMPFTKHGFKDATTNTDQIDIWWSNYPGASIGMPTGEKSGMWVLDVDGEEGFVSLKDLEAKQGSLPDTLQQKTGGGGRHYFFKYNGRDIKNSAGQVAKNLDVRGNGGYVVIPPSSHPSGKNYQWLNKLEPADPPEWLMDMVVSKSESPPSGSSTSYGNTPYGQTALANEIIKLSQATKGSRNATLNECAFCLSQLVAGGELDEGMTKNALISTGLTIGLKEKEIRQTIESGFKAGTQKPRQGEKSHECHECHSGHGMSRNVTQCHSMSRDVTLGHAPKDYKSKRFLGSLTGAIKEYIEENQGTITAAEIDRDFGLTHPADKTLRRKIMSRLLKEKIIKKDIRQAGKYHIVKSDIDFVDFTNVEISSFPVDLPIDLSSMVRIPRKSIIVVAGSTNSGKTAMAFEILKLNLHQSYPMMYLFSEMGVSECKQRIETAAPDDVDVFTQRVKCAECVAGFGNVISQYNPNGLTVVDFLEEVDGEYFRIPTDLRNIYDSLDTGIAVVCIQKHSKAEVGRGGEGTAEKPRLYLTVDKLVYQQKSTVSAVKIYKAKNYIGDNPNGLERHVAFGRYGANMEPLSDWIYCNDVQREKYKQHYQNRQGVFERKANVDEGFCIYFTTKSGASVRIVEKDLNKWRENFTNINVDKELIQISKDSDKKPFLDDNKYFFQLSGILNKRNQTA